jgi:dipeptidyl aminopeptidase/acylaminoacyl peptidase
VKIDLKTGEVTVLSSPNEGFLRKSLPTVRFTRIECCDAEFYGRLYLPNDYQAGKKYPLVFTNYLPSPGFYASVGDEVPIPVLTSHGIAVFAMSSRDSNVSSPKGDFGSEIGRVARPLRAMEWVRHKLSDEGIIDSERCGLTGLSYGAEIAMYAEWNSKVFRAVSAASGSWEPMNYVLAGLRFAEFLDSWIRGS